MRYTSTRDGSISCSFEEALCSGYAPDGGLFVPEQLPGPMTSDMLLQDWANMTYPDLTFTILRLFISVNDVPDLDLMQICQSSLQDFANPDHAVPVVKIGSLYIAELFHGPTFCFKDLGMRAVIQLLSYFATKRKRQTILLVATTGDTGPAAVQAVSDADNPLLNIVVHYPNNQISDFQRKSLTTVDSKNVRVVAFEGGGDDMDLPIKNILATCKNSKKDQETGNNNNNNTATTSTIGEQLHNALLTGVNSYNIGRPLMQMVHFVWTYLRIIEQLGYKHSAECCEQIPPIVDVVLPTGAMGNMAGGYMAKKMGLPLGKLNAGVNINDITYRVVQTGEFHRNPTMYKTLSEAINIQVPYNFERVLFYLTNGNHDLVRAWMAEMNHGNEQKMNLNRNDWLACLQRDFNSARVTDDEMCATMRAYLESYNYLVDPNTAVALCAAQKLGYTTVTKTTSCTASPSTTTTEAFGNERLSSSPPAVAAVAVLSTASPCKFQAAVTIAIGSERWNKYVQNGFPEAAKRIQQLPEIPPIMYHKEEEGCSLAECQIVWEHKSRDNIAQLIQGHQSTTS